MMLQQAAVLAGTMLGLSAGMAQAALVIDVNQVGSSVVVTGSGTLDISGLTFDHDYFFDTGLRGTFAYFGSGTQLQEVYGYAGLGGPTSIGPGASVVAPTMATGDAFGFNLEYPDVFVAPDFAGGALNFTSTFANQTIASLGLTNGSYAFTLPNDAFTLNINPVPLPASAPLFGAALLGLAGLCRARRRTTTGAA